MKVPNSNKAKISNEKILNYLLSETHPIGKSKAKFFRKYGFNENNFTDLKKALYDLLQNYDITDETASPYGIKYTVDGQIKTPSNKLLKIRTVWVAEKEQSEIYLVTAYPTK